MRSIIAAHGMFGNDEKSKRRVLCPAVVPGLRSVPDDDSYHQMKIIGVRLLTFNSIHGIKPLAETWAARYRKYERNVKVYGVPNFRLT